MTEAIENLQNEDANVTEETKDTEEQKNQPSE